MPMFEMLADVSCHNMLPSTGFHTVTDPEVPVAGPPVTILSFLPSPSRSAASGAEVMSAFGPRFYCHLSLIAVGAANAGSTKAKEDRTLNMNTIRTIRVKPLLHIRLG